MKARGKIRKLLITLGRIQTLIGKAQGIYMNDRCSSQADKLFPIFQEIFDLCVTALGEYDPLPEQSDKGGE